MKRKWVNMILGRLYGLALWPSQWPWPWSFKVRVWNSFVSWIGVADWHGTKRMWVVHSWPCYSLMWPWWDGRMYRIVTGVTSDVEVPSTYLFSVRAYKKSCIMFAKILNCPALIVIVYHCHDVVTSSAKKTQQFHDTSHGSQSTQSAKYVECG